MKIVFNCKGLAEELKERVFYCALFSASEYFAEKEEQEKQFFKDVKLMFGDNYNENPHLFADEDFYRRNFKERDIRELREIYERFFIKESDRYEDYGFDYLPWYFEYSVKESEIMIDFGEEIWGENCHYMYIIEMYQIGEAVHELWPEVAVTGGGELCFCSVDGANTNCRITAEPYGPYLVEAQYECIVCGKEFTNPWYSGYGFDPCSGSEYDAQCLCSIECAKDYINSIDNKSGKYYNSLVEKSNWFDDDKTMDDIISEQKAKEEYKEIKMELKKIK